MYKRIWSFLLAMTLLLGCMGGLSGCGDREVLAQTYVTQGEWIKLVDEMFGMFTYRNETPYYKNIDSQNPYFEAIQTAFEWEVIDGSVQEFDVERFATRGFAAVTLVNAGNFGTESMSGDEKIERALELKLFSGDRINTGEKLTYEEAVYSLNKAVRIWANAGYLENYRHVEYKEEVIDLTASAKDFYFEENQTVMSLEDAEKNGILDLQAGDIYVMPPQGTEVAISAYKAEAVEVKGGKVIIRNQETGPELEEVFEELQLQETTIPDLTQCVFYDPEGNVLYTPPSDDKAVNAGKTGSEKYTADYLQSFSQEKPQAEKTANGSMLNFTVGDWTVKCKIGSSSFNFKVDKKFSETKSGANEGKKNNKNNVTQKNTASLSFEVKDVRVTDRVDFSLWGGLKEAVVKADYETVISGAYQYNYSNLAARIAPYNNRNGKGWSNVARTFSDIGENFKYGARKGAESIKLGSFKLANGGVCTVTLDINLLIDITGKVTVTLTMKECKGIEYKNGNIRVINTQDKALDFDIKAAIELTCKIGINLRILKKSVAGFYVQGGAGMSVKAAVHVADSGGHLIDEGTVDGMDTGVLERLKEEGTSISGEALIDIAKSQGGTIEVEESASFALHVDLCFDFKVYGILRVGLEENCLVAGLLKVKFVHTFFDESNGTFLSAHVEDAPLSLSAVKAYINASCTKKYKPFDETAEKETETGQEAGQESETASEALGETEEEKPVTGIMSAKAFNDSLAVGETTTISVENLPEGYSGAELLWTSSNEAVAAVTDGVVKGCGEGAAVITIKTKDGLYSTTCAISVSSRNDVPFVPLETKGRDI